MKRAVSSILLVCIILSSFSAKSQVTRLWTKYSVSKSINTNNLNYKKLFRGKSKEALENNIANFYLYKNGVLIKPKTDSVHSFFTPGCLCFKFDDTLLLNSGLGRSAGVGVGIKIYNDKFTGALHANSGNASIYKYKKSDSLYTNNILAQPQTQSLKLLKTPTFLPNEIIIGEYQATYKRFYQKNKQKDESSVYTVRLLFKCKITGMDSMK